MHRVLVSGRHGGVVGLRGGVVCRGSVSLSDLVRGGLSGFGLWLFRFSLGFRCSFSLRLDLGRLFRLGFGPGWGSAGVGFAELVDVGLVAFLVAGSEVTRLLGPRLLIRNRDGTFGVLRDSLAERGEVSVGDGFVGRQAGRVERLGEGLAHAIDLRQAIADGSALLLRTLLRATASAAPAATAGALARRAAFGLHVVIVDEFDDGHLRVVALPEAELDDAGVAAGPVADLRGDVAEQFFDGLFVAEVAEGLSAAGRAVVLRAVDDRLDERAEGFRLRQRRLDPFVLDEGGAKGREGRLAVRRRAPELLDGLLVSHDYVGFDVVGA